MCDHLIKLEVKNTVMPVVSGDGGMRFLGSRGFPVMVKRLIFCASKGCEFIFKLEPLSEKRSEKVI